MRRITGISYHHWGQWVNSLWPSDAKWWHRIESTLAQVKACCLTAPSHYLNQCWLLISKDIWHLFEICTYKILDSSPRVQWVNSSPLSATYTHQRTGSMLIQVMACRLFGTKPLPEPSRFIVNWIPGNKFQWNSNWNSIMFIQENASEIVVCQNGGHFVQGEMS